MVGSFGSFTPPPIFFAFLHKGFFFCWRPINLVGEQETGLRYNGLIDLCAEQCILTLVFISSKRFT